MIRKINDEELEETRRICFIAFEKSIDNTSNANESAKNIRNNPVTRMKKNYKETFAWFDTNNVMQACVSQCIARANFDEGEILMSEVGDVASMQCCHGKKAIEDIFIRLFQDWYKKGVSFSYLYPFSGTYYDRLGYSYCVKQNQISIPLNKLQTVDQTWTYHIYSKNRLNDIKFIYEQFTKYCNLTIIREDIEWYHSIENFKPDQDFHFTYICYDKLECPCGYLSYYPEEKNGHKLMNCYEYAYANLDGLYSILSFFKSKFIYYDYLKISFADHVSLDLVFKEFNRPAGGTITIEQKMHGMVRVINILDVLKNHKFIGCGNIVLYITDKQITSNHGLWTISWEDGHLISAKHESSSSSNNADYILNINLFSRLISRGISPLELDYIIGRSSINNYESLLNLFPQRKCAIWEYF